MNCPVCGKKVGEYGPWIEHVRGHAETTLRLMQPEVVWVEAPEDGA